jgi:hypothetical protein
MRSEDRIQQALEAISGSGEAYRSAVAIAAEEARGLLSRHLEPSGDRAQKAAVELGQFAAGRIDPQKFATLLADGDEPEGVRWPLVARVHETLFGLRKRGDQVFLARVDPGGDLRATVEQALAEAGKAFGAARLLDGARGGGPEAEDSEDLLEAFPFRKWKRGERDVAPPLVVEVDGGDLHVGGLADFLDGEQKLLLVVRGDAPPAALVRLISPGVLVMQTTDVSDVTRLARHKGPSVAALVPEGAARFLHDPSKGKSLGERLSVSHIPDKEPTKRLGSVSRFQQTEDLRQLKELAKASRDATPPPAPETAPGAGSGQQPLGSGATAAGAAGITGAAPSARSGESEDAIAILAGWLLQQADLSDLKG